MLNIFFLSLFFAMTLFSTIVAITDSELVRMFIIAASLFAFGFMFMFATLLFGRGAKVEGGSASGRARGKTKGG